MSWWPERLGVEAADSCRADQAPEGDQAGAATPLAGEAVDAFTGRLVRDYRAALDNLTAVQARCTEQALEIRVLRRALRDALRAWNDHYLSEYDSGRLNELENVVEVSYQRAIERAREAVAR